MEAVAQQPVSDATDVANEFVSQPSGSSRFAADSPNAAVQWSRVIEYDAHEQLPFETFPADILFVRLDGVSAEDTDPTDPSEEILLAPRLGSAAFYARQADQTRNTDSIDLGTAPDAPDVTTAAAGAGAATTAAAGAGAVTTAAAGGGATTTAAAGAGATTTAAARAGARITAAHAAGASQADARRFAGGSGWNPRSRSRSLPRRSTSTRFGSAAPSCRR